MKNAWLAIAVSLPIATVVYGECTYKQYSCLGLTTCGTDTGCALYSDPEYPTIASASATAARVKQCESHVQFQYQNSYCADDDSMDPQLCTTWNYYSDQACQEYSFSTTADINGPCPDADACGIIV